MSRLEREARGLRREACRAALTYLPDFTADPWHTLPRAFKAGWLAVARMKRRHKRLFKRKGVVTRIGDIDKTGSGV